ncbi:hypothetical protein BY996DRAFT_1442767 [Phakopsora pachyrhizi]|nr:hypothetical protein BY996DRAFT_1442767 [Phakopsora pachyrhizi]
MSASNVPTTGLIRSIDSIKVSDLDLKIRVPDSKAHLRVNFSIILNCLEEEQEPVETDRTTRKIKKFDYYFEIPRLNDLIMVLGYLRRIKTDNDDEKDGEKEVDKDFMKSLVLNALVIKQTPELDLSLWK